ncbi:cilia- and flagella-associated protein 410 isoform X4 [Cydia pomonella]|uniref:cilia- and flagella-associated protein 410 isoform X4 n=1 Tax=Cydia pomonella TaxID=82600 RepID=UPI002ADE0DF7|nr:cilia- and flagella-associated protein 410 isoform X4 [Cydia pomonella]
MARLTEEMVIARSKQSDLSSIKKLNCWGAELGDVSLLRRMPNVEVLAFSINKIRSLQDFAGCRLLRELYVRKNEIKDLREIRHLRHLPALTSLWLDENPCTHHPQYRLTVLRNLPRLEKLDNVAVQQEELEEAQRRGSLIDSDDEGYPQQQEAYAESVRSGGSARRAARARSSDSSPERDYGRPEPACRDHRPEPACRDHRPEPACRDHRPEPACRDHRPEPEPYRDHQRHDQCPLSPTRRAAPPRASPDDERLEHPAAMTRSQYEEYAYAMNGECRLGVTSPHEQYCERGDNRSEYTPSTVGRGDWERERDREFPRERDAHSAGFPSAVMGEHRGFTRRPVTRNSNLLSAVLCLVKELDYPSLEVAEMAVRCRMDELANSQ